jgi:nucleotide-binding universal stress UspA family protein
MYERVVVPLDGSEEAEHALPHAIDFAVVAGTPLDLVRVVDIAHFDPYGTLTPGFLERDGVPELTTAETDAERYLEQVSERCAAQEAAVTHEVRSGWIVDELLRVLHPGDLLVIASHGRDRVERALFGSITTSLLKRSPVPVVIIRPRAS